MAGEQRLSILVADDDPGVIEDYRSILCPPKTSRAPDFDNPSRIEDEVFGAALAHDAFPEVDLTSVGRSEDAVEAVRRAVAENRPFAAAFIDAELRGDDRGLEAAEAIRALAPDLPIVLVAARCGMHPADVCARIPPADRVSILVKPFHAAEIQQLALTLAARRTRSPVQDGALANTLRAAAIRPARHAQTVPRIPLRHAESGRPTVGSAVAIDLPPAAPPKRRNRSSVERGRSGGLGDSTPTTGPGATERRRPRRLAKPGHGG